MLKRDSLIKKVNSMVASKEIERTITRATKNNNEIPEEKTLRKLIWYVEDKKHEDVLYFLWKRLFEKNAIAVLKSLYIIHFLSFEAHSALCHSLSHSDKCYFGHLLNFTDYSTPNGIYYSRIINSYSIYLTERFYVCKKTGGNWVNGSLKKNIKKFNNSETRKLLHFFKLYQRLLETLCRMKIEKIQINHFLCHQLCILCVRDCSYLYVLLSQLSITLLTRFFSLSNDEATNTIKKIRVFYSQMVDFGILFNLGRKLSPQTDIPSITEPPTSFLEELETYLEDKKLNSQNPNNIEKKSLTPKFQIFNERKSNELINFDNVQPDLNSLPLPYSSIPNQIVSNGRIVSLQSLNANLSVLDLFDPIKSESMLISEDQKINSICNIYDRVDDVYPAPIPTLNQFYNPNSILKDLNINLYNQNSNLNEYKSESTTPSILSFSKAQVASVEYNQSNFRNNETVHCTVSTTVNTNPFF